MTDLFGQALARASHSVKRGISVAAQMSATYGLRSSASSASAALQRSLANRLPALVDSHGGTMWRLIWRAKATPLAGWTAEDLHEYLLGEIYGWETVEGFGRKRMKPIRRSSRMSTGEFADYVAQIQRRMATLGIYVPDPNEEMPA